MIENVNADGINSTQSYYNFSLETGIVSCTSTKDKRPQ